MAMSYVEATALNVGDVIVLDNVFDCYPHYYVDAGARLVVAHNSLTTAEIQRHWHGELRVRVVREDLHLAGEYGLAEWNFEIIVSDPVTMGYEADGLDPTDPESQWHTLDLPFVRANGDVDIVERIAIVFCSQVWDNVGADLRIMTEIARRNAARKDDFSCATHDFFDANFAMHDAFHEMGLPVIGDDGCEDGTDCGEASCYLWGAAWAVAMRHYLSQFLSAEDEGGVITTAEGDIAPL